MVEGFEGENWGLHFSIIMETIFTFKGTYPVTCIL
jgi:hypothetical protein